MNIASTELKTHLGKYLRLVQTAMRIVITDRGEPVAMLTCLPSAETTTPRDAIQFSSIPSGTHSIRNITFPKLRKSARSSMDWLREERGERE